MQNMQAGFMIILSAALACLGAGGAAGAAEGVTPITMVVGLLKGMQTKLEQDFEAEQDLFQKYECWYKTVVDQKTATNTAAQTRKESLETYIQDIESGKFEFTTERVDLEKQIASLKQDIQVAGDLRTKENQDYEAAKQEMEQAISALQEAIQVLEGGESQGGDDQGQQGQQEQQGQQLGGALLARRSTVSFADARQSLQEALRLGQSVLLANDAQLIKRMLAGEVPQKDWKKLNRKATFKMKYKSQTSRITKTLKDLEQTFAENLADANQKETAAQTSHDKLKASKDGMLSNAEQALIDLVGEKGASDLTKSQAQEEVDALAEQIAADTKFVQETKSAHTQKQSEWAERERLRRLEITAISDAIAVLHDDEARDTFKSSYKSQGYFFLQERTKSHSLLARRQRHVATVAQTLHELAKASSDPRLSMLATEASAVSSTRTFAAVITQIDNLVATLKGEETTDLTNKESCESTRAEKTRMAKTQSVAIDEVTDEIERAQAKVEVLEGEMKEQDEAVVKLNNTLVELEQQRVDEHAEYVKGKADDQKAVELIEKAIGVLAKLKEDMAGLAVNSTVHLGATEVAAAPARPAALAAVSAHLHGHATAAKGAAAAEAAVHAAVTSGRSLAARRQPFAVEAGAAPPPPPPTWSQPTYSGSKDEASGIHAILHLLADDIKADITAADTAESNAVTAYDSQKSDLEQAIQAAKDAHTDFLGQKGQQESDGLDKRQDRTSKMGELKGTMDYIKAMVPGCDFILINYDQRRINRQVETDGLLKAKAILQGAKFS